MKRITLGFSLLLMLIGMTVHASVLGNPISGGSQETDLSCGAVLKHNEFMSSSVGKQTENYVEYIPGSGGISMAVPVVVTGWNVHDRKDLAEAADYMQNNGMKPLMGINADFFDMNGTGVHRDDTVINGKIISQGEQRLRCAVGFRADGTAFIDYLGMDTMLSHNGTTIPVTYINKQPTDGNKNVFLLTKDFADTTNTKHKALYVVCSAKEGELSIDSVMKLQVKSVFTQEGPLSISAGDMILTVDADGTAKYVNMLSGLKSGDVLTLTNTVYGAEKHDWREALHIAATHQPIFLVRNGQTDDDSQDTPAPRTAVGVKPDGKIIFYTIDGRQSGYSYGCSLGDLAKRMQELGCIDAINFDGGGSTSMGIAFPGSGEFTVANKPSGVKLRKVSNFIFLRDMRGLTCNIYFDSSGNAAITKSVSYGGGYPAMSVPEKAGYVFEGYYSGANGTGARYYDADCRPEHDRYLLTDDLTLYAYWRDETDTAKRAEIKTAPAAMNVIYNGSAQELISAGTAKYAGTAVAYRITEINGIATGADYGFSVPKATEPGIYTIQYRAGGINAAGNAWDDTNYVRGQEYTLNAVISKCSVYSTVLTEPAAVNNLIYNGGAQELVIDGITSHNDICYKIAAIDGKETQGTYYGYSIPTAKDAGVYTIYWQVRPRTTEETEHYFSSTRAYTLTVEIAQTPAGTPAGKTLTYNSAAQELINAGYVASGTMKYYASTTKLSADPKASSFSSSIPTGTAAGTYYVYYYVESTDTSVDGTSPSKDRYVITNIEKLTAEIATEPTAVTGLVYDGTPHALVNAGTVRFEGTDIAYRIRKINNETITSSFGFVIPTATEAGTYTVEYRAGGKGSNNRWDNKNYNQSAIKTLEVTISNPGINVDVGNVNGSSHPRAKDKTYDKEYRYTMSISDDASVAADDIEVTIGGVKADNGGFLKRKLGVITGGNVEFTAGIKGIPEGTTLGNIECVVSVKYSLDGIPVSQDHTFTLE